MRDNIYEYLINYGFTSEQLTRYKKENEDLYFVVLNIVKDNIEFLTKKGFTTKEIINIVDNNPFMLTVTSKRKNAFEDIYINKLNLSNEEIKYLLMNNYDMYTCSPVELNKIIDYLNNKGYSMDNIKKLLLSNTSIIDKNLDDIIKLFN